ncbi:MAG: hypothetical protein GF401_03740 [Chitinivibrionales bacterium]|nr:hypothetical protein [Chitinivibrionales bacterium]
MLKKAFFSSLFVVAISFSVFAVSGICVSTYHGPLGYGIDMHTIINDRWIDSTFLVNVENRNDARFPQINSYGTHVAFFKNESDGWYVCVMRLGGVNKTIKKLTKVPTGDVGDGRIWSMILEWPRGEHVYYTTSKSNEELYRVHVQTGDAEKVVEFSSSGNQIQLSGNVKLANTSLCSGDWSIIQLPELGGGVQNVTCGNTIFENGSGCGLGISPSGVHTIHNNNGFHSRVAVGKIDTVTWTWQQDRSVGEDGNIDHIMWNSWSVDTLLKNQVYDDKNHVYRDGIYQTIGGGNLTIGGWSTNSDYWALMYCGWSPQGRDFEDGSNIIAMNWQKEKTLNLTRHPCKYDTINNPEGYAEKAWNGDFWISAPVEDIAPGYIDDYNNRDSYEIDGTDIEVASLFDRFDPANDQAGLRGAVVQKSNRGLKIQLPQKGKYLVEIFDARGRMERRIHCESTTIIPLKSLKPGVKLVNISNGTAVVWTESITRY